MEYRIKSIIFFSILIFLCCVIFFTWFVVKNNEKNNDLETQADSPITLLDDFSYTFL